MTVCSISLLSTFHNLAFATKTGAPGKTLQAVIYAYVEPDSENEDGNKPGSNSIKAFSINVSEIAIKNLNSLYPGKFATTKRTGTVIKRVHYELDKINMPYNFCNANEADFLVSIYSEDNSTNDPYSRNISLSMVDCKARRNYRKIFKISNNGPNNEFDYEQGINNALGTFINGLPPYISLSSIKSSRASYTAPSGKIVFYSYAQPGHYDKEMRITGSNTSEAYSKNSAALLKHHVLNRFNKNIDTHLYSGKRFNQIYHQLEETDKLQGLCSKDNASLIFSSYSENSAGRFIHFRHVTYTVANCENKRVYFKKYRLDRDEKSDKFGYELNLHSTFQDFLLKLPPYIAMTN